MENWDLIGKKLSGELDPAESLRFEEWLKSDASHELLWKDSQKIWSATGTLDVSFEADTEKALDKFKQSCVTRKPVIVKGFFTPLKIAASVLLLATSAFLIIQYSGEKKPVVVVRDNSRKVPTPVFVKTKMITMSTTDSAVSFYLSDSSHIYLNKNSSLTYPENFNGIVRAVTLSGEAFFDVTSDPKKPFVIEAGNTETKVTGTSFNIKEDKRTKKVEVSVVTGQVTFRVKKNSEHLSEAILLPQDRIVYSEGNATMVKQKVKVSEEYWWVRNFKAIRKLFQDAFKSDRKK